MGDSGGVGVTVEGVVREARRIAAGRVARIAAAVV